MVVVSLWQRSREERRQQQASEGHQTWGQWPSICDAVGRIGPVMEGGPI